MPLCRDCRAHLFTRNPDPVSCLFTNRRSSVSVYWASFTLTVDELRTFLNTPTLLPQWAVSVSAVSNGFHIIFFE